MSVSDNKFIPSEDRDFFILLRAGLWQKADEPLSPTPDWDYIFRLSMEQTVQGIIADGLSLYRKAHPELSITYAQSDPFLAACTKVMSRNRNLNQLQAKICKLFDDNGISYVVLKGQVVAQCYPKPDLRVPGDIDFFFEEDDYFRAKEIITGKANAEGHQMESRLHYSANLEDITIELHGPEGFNFGNRIKNVMLQEFDQMILGKQSYSYDNCETNANSASHTYHSLFIFMHCLQHYYVTGLGIRQICDLAMYLHKHHKGIEPKYLYSKLKSMKLLHAWNVFYFFCVQWLGLTNESEQLRGYEGEDISNKVIASIWTVIKKSGDMGRHKELHLDKGFILQKLNLFIAYLQSSGIRHDLSPEIERFMWARNCKEKIISIPRLLRISK